MLGAVSIVLFMGLIGALIGGFTNFIAIKMLFRPFEPVFLFGKHLPFTPGLIPKRRNELSLKIGEMVTHHLLTPEVFKEKIMTPQFEKLLKASLLKQFIHIKEKNYTMQQLAMKFDVDLTSLVESKAEAKLNEITGTYIAKKKDQPLKAIIPQDIQRQLAVKMDDVTPLLLLKMREYVLSSKGYNDILMMIDRFFQEKGKVISMIQMFMTREMIAERVQKEFVKLSQEESIKMIIVKQLTGEYDKLLEKTPSDFADEKEMDAYRTKLTGAAVQRAGISHYMNTPLPELAPNLFTYMESDGLDRMIHFIISKTAENISVIMEKIRIAEIIKDQIDQFELSFLEQLVIEISNKELKMITLLGFVLGGLIGLIQGVIALFV